MTTEVRPTTEHRFANARLKVSDLEVQLREAKHERDLIEERLLEEFGEKGIQSVKVKDVGTIYVFSKVSASLPENKEDAYAALRAEGLSDLIKEVVNPSTLSAYVKECREDGGDLPLGLQPHIKVTEVFNLGMRRS